MVTGNIGKWEIAKNASTEFVPLSVADMEFPTARPIVESIKKLAEEAILGYTNPTQEYYDAVISWMKRRHDFEIKKEWLLQTPGIINALSMLIETVTAPGDGVIVMPPVYYPFDMTIIATGRRSVFCPLINKDGRYEIDFDLLEEKAKDSGNTAIIFCNPHNPIGQVWSREDVERVCEICAKNNVTLISDEIHADLRMRGVSFTSTGPIARERGTKCISCYAPSKTFNIPGLASSFAVTLDEGLRTRFQTFMEAGEFSSVDRSLDQRVLIYCEVDAFLTELCSHLIGLGYSESQIVNCYDRSGFFKFSLDLVDDDLFSFLCFYRHYFSFPAISLRLVLSCRYKYPAS